MTKNLKLIWQILSIYRYSVIFLFFLSLSAAFTEVMGIGMIMPLLEVITNSDNSSSVTLNYLQPVLQYVPDYYHLMTIGALMVSLVLIKNILMLCKTGFWTYLTFRFRKLWQCAIIEKYMYAEYPYLLSKKQGTLLNDLINEPGKAAKSLAQFLDFTSRSILAFFIYGLLFFVNWKMTLLVTFLSATLILLINKISYTYSIDVGKKKLTLSQELTAVGAENISAIRQVKLFSLENDTCKKFTEKLDHLLRILLKFSVIHNLPKLITETLLVTGVVSVLLFLQYISKLSLSSIIPILGLYALTSLRFFTIVSTLFAQRMNILTYIPSLELVHNLYISNIDAEKLKEGKVITKISGDIQFKNISFSYPESKPLFRDFNIQIPVGKVTAIVGPSGSGKSTIVDLLVGFFKVQAGEILINGTNINKINLTSWRRSIGYVSQDTFLFNTTVKENILIGKPGASEVEIMTAARKANADQFISALPQGYDTLLGDRGVKISGGQRQRIAIARAIIRDPELLIFDEATSALDSESEMLIQESINNLADKKKYYNNLS